MLDLQRAVRLDQTLYGERIIRLEFAAASLLGVGLAVLTARQIVSATTTDSQGLLVMGGLLALFVGLAVNYLVLFWLSRGPLPGLARVDARREMRSIGWQFTILILLPGACALVAWRQRS